MNSLFRTFGVLAFLGSSIYHSLELLGDGPTIQLFLSSNSRIQRSRISILSSLGFFSEKMFSHAVEPEDLSLDKASCNLSLMPLVSFNNYNLSVFKYS